MNDVTRILDRIEQGDQLAAAQLLPLVYDDLRKLAAARMTSEPANQTLQGTALVHEAYLRLVEGQQDQHRWKSRSQFFAAAAEAMRRILVENARRKGRHKHGGAFQRKDQEMDLLTVDESDPLLVIAMDEALDRLAKRSPRKVELVKLRYFLGCTLPEAAEILGISASTAEDDWTHARAWLRREWLRGSQPRQKEEI